MRVGPSTSDDVLNSVSFFIFLQGRGGEERGSKKKGGERTGGEEKTQ